MEVTNFTLTTLEASLFEVPSDYAEAKSAADLLPSLAKGGSLAEALMGSTAAGTATAAPKRAGTIRVGVLEPVNRSGRELPTQTMREELVAMYRKAPYEALPLAGDSPAAIAQDASRLECDYILFTEVAEVKTSKPGKVGGLLRRAAGDGSSQPKHDVRIDYKLYPVADTRTARANGSGKASTGGFGVGSALRMAAFAGQTYMRFMGLGRMGGLMNPLMSMPGMGGGLGAGMGFFDPRASAMSSMAQMALGGGLPGLGGLSGLDGPENAGLPETISEAVSNTARDTIEQLNKPKK
jgi:hypothetical protein